MVLSIAGETGAVFTHPHNTPNFYTSFCFCTWYFIANKVSGFGSNTSCIKRIKSTYKAKEGSKGCQMRGITEYQEAEWEAEKEARKEFSRTKGASRSESGAGAAVERSTKKTRQVVSKRTRASASLGEPSQKKTRKGSDAASSAQVFEIIPSSIEGKEEEEEEEEEEVSALRPWGLRSRGPVVLAKVESAGQSVVAKGVMVVE